jgi:hypothetical protein
MIIIEKVVVNTRLPPLRAPIRAVVVCSLDRAVAGVFGVHWHRVDSLARPFLLHNVILGRTCVWHDSHKRCFLLLWDPSDQ